MNITCIGVGNMGGAVARRLTIHEQAGGFLALGASPLRDDRSRGARDRLRTWASLEDLLNHWSAAHSPE
jgi:3-hydroxyisobutyrate dehydrogenase-like beta-hydroxyacid dehydrogenase